MTDPVRDDPPADLYRQILESEARLKLLVEQLFQAEPRPAPMVSPGRRSPTAPPVEQMQFTAREVEVLPLLIVGYTNQQIGAELELSAGTIRNRLGRIYKKLGVTTRTQAAIRAMEFGLASADPATGRRQPVRRAVSYDRRRESPARPT